MEQSSQLTVITVLMIGFVLGLRHALEADHMAAVSTIVTEKRTFLSAAFVGALWGIGHTISLLLVGLGVIFLKLQISGTVQSALEAIVGVMLVGLGISALRKLARSKEVHIHPHEHSGMKHTHVHAHRDEPGEASHHRFSPRSVLIGMVHGLAGSAALMLLVVPTIRSEAIAVSYILVFGVGSIGGMMVMSLVISVPLYLTADRSETVKIGMRLGSGLFSTILGLVIIYHFVASSLTA